MARIRTIKPQLWESQKLGRLSTLSRLNFIGLISMADDQGRGRGDTRFLFGHLHAYAKSVTESDVQKSFDELEKNHLVAFYDVEDCRYYALPGWHEHQVISHPSASDKPAVPAAHPMADLFRSGSGGTPESLRRDSRGNGREGKGMEGITTGPGGPDGSSLQVPTGKTFKDAAGFDQYRLPAGFGKYGHAYVRNIPPDECRFIITTMKPGPKVKAALEWRINLKADEARR